MAILVNYINKNIASNYLFSPEGTSNKSIARG